MSLPITQALVCPHCGKKTETLMWQSINVSLDNDEAQQHGGEYIWPKEIAEAVNFFWRNLN
ncbi:MAG: hypothetical protein ACLP2Y_06625 [Limisphaerales bacterium]